MEVTIATENTNAPVREADGPRINKEIRAKEVRLINYNGENLGVVSTKDNRSFVMADLPGLIKGAHEGKGLGLKFLRHIQRCRVIIHLVSMDGIRDPYESYKAIREELEKYGFGLLNRPEIIVASKMDEEATFIYGFANETRGIGKIDK